VTVVPERPDNDRWAERWHSDWQGHHLQITAEPLFTGYGSGIRGPEASYILTATCQSNLAPGALEE